MKKVVPDPPHPVTTFKPLGCCRRTHKPLLAVCEGVELESALAHLSLLLTSAFETNAELCDTSKQQSISRLAWSTWQSLELCQALVDSMLEGNQKPMTGL